MTLLALLFYVAICSAQVFAIDCNDDVTKQAKEDGSLNCQDLTGDWKTLCNGIKKFVPCDERKSIQIALKNIMNDAASNLLRHIDQIRSHIETLKVAESGFNVVDNLFNVQIKQVSNATENIKDLKINFKINAQKRNLTEITSACRDELVSSSTELRKNEIQFQIMTDRIAQLEERNSKLDMKYKNITQVAREEKLALNLKIKELKQNLTQKSEEIYELQQNNSNLVLLNQNTEKTAEDLQKELTSLNFLRSNLKEYCKLELNNQFNARDGDNRTALLRAARRNQASTVKALIDLGANLDLQDNNNNTALIWAAINSNTEICKLLLEAGADVNIRNKWGNTALILAAERNNIEMVKMLLAKGAQVNLAGNYGNTALHWAAIDGYVELAKLLVGHGANINVKNNAGATPLKRALSNNKTEVANYLKSVGATE